MGPRSMLPRNGYFPICPEMTMSGKTMPQPSSSFITGKVRKWVLLDWRVEGCILRQRLYHAPTNRSDRLEDITQAGIVTCVWELPVLRFERRAWIDVTMRKRGDLDLETYLAPIFDGVVWPTFPR